MINSLDKYFLKAMIVLYIDDENSIPEYAKNIMSLFFSKTYYVNKIEDAQNIYELKKPDLIISEIFIGNTNYISFLQNIRIYNDEIPIIITSNNSDKHILIELIKLQVIDFIEKKIESGKLIGAINKASKKILKSNSKKILLFDNIYYNFSKKHIEINNNSFVITRIESKFLELLIKYRDKTLSKDVIEKYLWGEKFVSDSALKSLLSRFRNKIGVNIIINSPGKGYCLYK